MEGMTVVEDSIKQEYKIGLGHLPASEFSHLFRNKVEELLKKSDETLMNWITIIRQGRILMDSTNLVEDDITHSKALQSWLGISYSLTEKEGQDSLIESVEEEMKTGLEQLPQWYSRYFEVDTTTLLQRTTSQLKLWLVTIKNGRKRYDQENILDDEFSYERIYQDWLGL